MDRVAIAPAQERWAAAHTQPHRERVALQNIERQGFRAYCPMIQKRVRHARQSRDVLRPLFPGYVFVHFNPSLRNWRPITSTIGVRSFVRCGSDLGMLDEGFIAGLRSREVNGAIQRPEQPYEIGQQVRIAGGAFDNLVATIIEMSERERLTVLMDILNNRVRVSVYASGVVAV